MKLWYPHAVLGGLGLAFGCDALCTDQSRALADDLTRERREPVNEERGLILTVLHRSLSHECSLWRCFVPSGGDLGNYLALEAVSNIAIRERLEWTIRITHLFSEDVVICCCPAARSDGRVWEVVTAVSVSGRDFTTGL